MAVEAFVGLVGGGKSYNSVRRMMAYMARGGRCCSNILLTGYDTSSCSFVSDSPVLSYLKSIGWNYQHGQYTFISFDDMVSNPLWIKRVPAGIDRDHRTLLVVDEATDLFDSLDGGRLRVDSAYREIFHFLRLSRHVHVDVLFVVQDLASINTRLRGLVSYIWRSTDMKNFRLPKFKIPFPFNLFMLQQFDRSGKFEVRREWVSKDFRVFGLYQSEAFNNSLSVKWDGVSVSLEEGRRKEKKKMTKSQVVLLVLSVVFSAVALFRSFSLSDRSLGRGGVVTNVVYQVSSNVVVASSSPSVSTSLNDDVVVKRGRFRYFPRSASSSDYVLYENAKLFAGSPCEYGYIKSITKDMVMGETFKGGIFYLLPEFTPPPLEDGVITIKRSASHTSCRGPF